MKRLNCWEYKKCGRESSGINVNELGVCSAALPSIYDGQNHGTYSGRICWTIVGTYNNQKSSCEVAIKLKSCLYCDFMKYVNEQEGRSFVIIPHKNIS